jgi:hypothetical protein
MAGPVVEVLVRILVSALLGYGAASVFLGRYERAAWVLVASASGYSWLLRHIERRMLRAYNQMVADFTRQLQHEHSWRAMAGPVRKGTA